MSQLERAFLEFLDLPPRRWRDEAREERGRYWTGPGRDGLEVAFTSLPSRPTTTQIRKLWAERHGRRAAPLLLVAEHDGQAWLCGPLGDNPTVATCDLSQAERLAAAALSEPSRHFAAQFLARAMDVDPDDVPGLINRGLLSSHELKTGVPARPDWDDAVQRAQPLLAKSDRALVEGLGFDVEEHPKHSVLRVRTNGNARAVAVFLNETEQPDAPSDRYDRQTPVTYALNQADKAKLPYVMAVRGSNVRLYSTATSGAVGQRGRTETFVGLDLPLLPTDQAGYLPLLFSADALSEGGTFDEVAEASASFAVDLSARLRERVYTQVIPRLAHAIANRTGAARETKADLDEHYRVAVTVLFRLLFIAYAEDSRLLPANHPAYAPHSLKTLARSQADAINAGRDLGFDNPLTEVVEPDTDTTSTDLWDTCRNLFIAVDKGRDAWSVPIYNGGLFSSDEAVNPAGPTIADLQLTNAEVGPALVALLVDQTPDGTVGPIDFRSLSVREFGTIYEGLLESELARAETDLTVTRDSARGDVYAPANHGDDVVVEAGGVYLHNKSGARKSSGSYFTKPFAVQHLIDTAVLSTLDKHLECVQGLLDKGDEVGAADALFDFRVADIAMGSGHFLTAVVDALEARYATFLADQPIPHVTAMLETLRRASHHNLGELADTVDIETSALLRRLIARRCVYGVDINPISVELARVSMWIHTFVPGLPLSFLNHNLRVGDSLTGVGNFREAEEALTTSGAQAGLFDDPIREALASADEPLRRLSQTIDLTTEDIKAARAASNEAREAVQPLEDLFSLLIANRLGRIATPTIGSLDDLDDAEVRAAREATAELSALHFPVAFPEVFSRERSGFDVVIGNPPWDKVEADVQVFLTARFPGFKGLPQAERERISRSLRDERPELFEAFMAERNAKDAQREVLLAGPYPGMGTDHPDLAKAFAWRFFQVCHDEGSVGIILPRTVATGRAMQSWREQLFENPWATDLLLVGNAGGYTFEEVDGRKEFVFLASKKAGPHHISTGGPLRTRLEWDSLRDSTAPLRRELLGERAEFPQVPTSAGWDVLAAFFESPAFADSKYFLPSVYETDASKNKPDFVFDVEAARPELLPVYKGASMYLWKPDTGTHYAAADPIHIRQVLRDKFKASKRRTGSPFAAWPDEDGLPFDEPRIAYRWTCRATDSRTLIVSLVPANTVLTNGIPYLVDSTRDAKRVMTVLAVLASVPFDWVVRRYVETTMRQGILNAMPFPEISDPRLASLLANTSAALTPDVDGLHDWLRSGGVVPNQSAGATEDLLVTLDAAVLVAYGLDGEQVRYVYDTFHPTWDAAGRRDAVLQRMAELMEQFDYG